MRRLVVVAVLAVVAVVLWFVADEQEVRQRLDEIGDAVFEQAGGTAPNWGDVADRVGDFAREERDLRQAVRGADAAQQPEAPAEGAE